MGVLGFIAGTSLFFKYVRKLSDKVNPQVRDFTAAEENRLVSIIKETNTGEDLFHRYFVDSFARWLEKNSLLMLIAGPKDYIDHIVDMYNFTEKDIKQIFNKARNEDKYSFGPKVQSFVDQSNRINMMVDRLADYMNPNAPELIASGWTINQRMAGFGRTSFAFTDESGATHSETISDILAAMKQSKKALEAGLSSEAITRFCGRDDAKGFFTAYNEKIMQEALKDLGLGDKIKIYGGTIIYEGAEIAVDTLWTLIEAVLGKNMTGKNEYSMGVMREKLDEMMGKIISAEGSHSSFVKSHELAKETIQKEIKNYLKEDGKKSKFGEFAEALGGIDVVEKYVEAAPEILDCLYTDYTKGLDTLEILAQNADGAEMKSVLNQMKSDYRSKWIVAARKVLDASEEGITSIVDDYIKDGIPVYGAVKTIGDVSGAKGAASGYVDLKVMVKMESDLGRAYEAAIQKVRSTDQANTEEYEKALREAETMFNLQKQTTISMLKAYGDLNSLDMAKQIEINAEIERVEKINMWGSL